MVKRIHYSFHKSKLARTLFKFFSCKGQMYKSGNAARKQISIWPKMSEFPILRQWKNKDFQPSNTVLYRPIYTGNLSHSRIKRSLYTIYIDVVCESSKTLEQQSNIKWHYFSSRHSFIYSQFIEIHTKWLRCFSSYYSNFLFFFFSFCSVTNILFNDCGTCHQVKFNT